MGEAALRRAQVDDAGALARLRVQMYEAWMGPIEGHWLADWEAFFARRLAEVDCFAGFLVEQDGEVLAGGTGHLVSWMTGPNNPTGVTGHVANMCTVEHARRQGHARAVLVAILDWFRERGVVRADLKATSTGRPLYEELGFAVPDDVYLQATLTQGPARASTPAGQ